MGVFHVFSFVCFSNVSLGVLLLHIITFFLFISIIELPPPQVTMLVSTLVGPVLDALQLVLPEAKQVGEWGWRNMS